MFKFLRNLIIGTAFVLPLAITSVPALAGTTTTTFTVTATVTATCSVTAGNLGFGNYDPSSGTAATQTSTINVTCTQNAPYTIALSYGGTGTVTNRIMTSGSNNLDYNLYTDAAYSNVWQDTTGCSTVPNVSANCDGGTGTGAAQPYTVYGQIPASQSVPTGTYSDTITVTVTF